MKIYLDVSCLNRPFDDQSQARIQLEANAVTLIVAKVDAGLWTQVSSDMATVEIDAIDDRDRKARVRLLLPSTEGLDLRPCSGFGKSRVQERRRSARRRRGGSRRGHSFELR